ncbi:12452_t:CDS:2, partial [Funneliformis caledonium]
DIFLKEVVKSLSDMIFRHYFIFPVLTGIHASSLFSTVKSTNAKFEEIYLPLLKSNHAKEVILELANRKQNNPKFCEILIKRTKEIINSKYNHYFDHFKKEENTEIIPLLVAYSLFDIGISRVESIGTKRKRKFEELEQEDIIFIDKNLDGKHSIKLPFLILHELYSQHQNPSITLDIKLLKSLDIALSPDENKRVTLSVFVFRLWTIYHTIKNERNDGLFQCKLSRLVPLRNGQKDRVLKFHPWFSKSFVNQVQNQQQQRYKECIAYQNKGKVPFADSFILTEPPILIQDKQSITSQKKQIIVTDEIQRDNSDEKLKNNEILISFNNIKAVFREILAFRKLYCIERA